MHVEMVKAHKMYCEYHDHRKPIFIGVYDQDQLVELFDNFNQQFFRIMDTYLWLQPHTQQVYFVQDEFERLHH